jgi:integrase
MADGTHRASRRTGVRSRPGGQRSGPKYGGRRLSGVFGRILSTAETDGVIPRTPCRGIRLPRQTSQQCFLTPEEVRRLADAIEDRYRILIYTAAYTGMCWGELAGLRVPRLGWLRGTIEVTEALTEVNGTIRTGPTKTGKSRTVSIPGFLVELLAAHLTTLPAEAASRGTRHHVEDSAGDRCPLDGCGSRTATRTARVSHGYSGLAVRNDAKPGIENRFEMLLGR